VITVRLAYEPRDIWRAGVVLVGLTVLFLFGRFVLADGGLVLFTVIMSWLASIAMEPAVHRLATRMRRGLATGLVMLTILAAVVGFFTVFGNLLALQLRSFIASVPDILDSVFAWLNRSLGVDLDTQTVLNQVNLGPDQITGVATDLAGGLFGIVASVLGGVFSLFTLGLFTFYFSADAPRLKRWVARLMPPGHQEVFLTVWDIAVQKTGGYVAARVVLSAICAAITALWLAVIGMDYWLPLGIWTGIVSQFVPTIGTYIAIALPVVVGLSSSQPFDGVLALGFALVYQQIENLTIEPRISANAVDMHPAVAFGSVLLGGALFGVGGALVAIPVAALALALFEIYSRKYDLLPQLAHPAPGEAPLDDEEDVDAADAEAAMEEAQERRLDVGRAMDGVPTHAASPARSSPDAGDPVAPELAARASQRPGAG
jgi:predicted PurR-regulated permease PerM